MGKMSRATRRRVKLRRIHDGARACAKQAQAFGKLFNDRSADHCGERWVIPGPKPRRNVFRADSNALHGGIERAQRLARKFSAVFLAGKAFFLMITNNTSAAVA